MHLLVGVMLTCVGIAMVVPFQVMSSGPQPASNSVLLTRPTNGFSGFYSAVKHGQIFPAVVALMTILSEFMPILLTNIPYTLSQVRISHDICVWITVGILAFMALTIIVSFIVRWPNMPIDPRSIAGAMYYVSESAMVDQFTGTASLNNKQREQRIKELGGTYMYVELTTKSGKRPAVEWSDYTVGMVAAVPQMKEKSYSHVTHESIDTAYHGYAARDLTHSRERSVDNGYYEYPQQEYTQVSNEQDTGHAGYRDERVDGRHRYGDYRNEQVDYRDQQGNYRDQHVDYRDRHGDSRDQQVDYRNNHADITDEHIDYHGHQQEGYAQVRNENLDTSYGGYEQRGHPAENENAGTHGGHDQRDHTYESNTEYYGYRH